MNGVNFQLRSNSLVLLANERIMCDKMKAHIEGLKHYAFSVIIRNDLGMILLQKRALTKYHSGGLWSNACCGHPLDISSYQSVNNSAKIRLQEELNINSKLSFLFQSEYSAKCNSLVENEIDYVFEGKSNQDTLHYNPQEVCEVRWITVKDLIQEIKQTPDIFTPWFLILMDKYI